MLHVPAWTACNTRTSVRSKNVIQTYRCCIYAQDVWQMTAGEQSSTRRNPACPRPTRPSASRTDYIIFLKRQPQPARSTSPLTKTSSVHDNDGGHRDIDEDHILSSLSFASRAPQATQLTAMHSDAFDVIPFEVRPAFNISRRATHASHRISKESGRSWGPGPLVMCTKESAQQ